MTEYPRQKFKYLENEKVFKMKLKAFFIICKKLSAAKNCFRLASNLISKSRQSVYFGRFKISQILGKSAKFTEFTTEV